LQGRGDRAVEHWNLINPVYHATTVEEVQHYKVEPYVACADVYGAPPHTGRGVRSVELDGQPLPNNTVPLSDDGKNHNVSVELG